MDTIKDNQITLKRLSADEGFYINVFNKTEKILSVVIYILSQIDKRQVSQSHIEMVKDRVLQTHQKLINSLSLLPAQVEEGLLELQYELLGLESGLRLVEATGHVPTDVNHLLFTEIDAVQRYINNHYTNTTSVSLSLTAETTSPKVKSNDTNSRSSSSQSGQSKTPRTKKRIAIPAGDISSDAYLVHSQLTDRAERIKTILEAKPQASVKDISEVITDISEKTIQRELNSLIEKGQVIREGEKRWSRYSVKK